MRGRSRPAKVGLTNLVDESRGGNQQADQDLVFDAADTYRGRILVADDERAIVDVLALLLDDVGYQVVRAYDGREALDLARAYHPDVIVSDDYMPRLTGEELVRRIHADRDLAKIPIILMSAVPTPLLAGSAPFMAKPFDLDELLDLIESVVVSSEDD